MTSFRDNPPDEVIDRSVLFSKGTVEELEDCVDINDDDDFANDSPVMGTVATAAAEETKVNIAKASVPSAETLGNPTSQDKEVTVTASIPETTPTHVHSDDDDDDDDDDAENNTDDNLRVDGGRAVTLVTVVSDASPATTNVTVDTELSNANISAPVVEIKEIPSATMTAADKPSADEASADDVPATKTTWSSRLSTLGGRMIGKGGQKDGTVTATTGSTASTAQSGTKEQEKTAASGEAPVPKGILKGVASSIYQSSTGLGSRMLGRKEETAPSPERKTITADTEGSLADNTQPKGSTAASIFQASKRKMFSFGRTPANPN